MKHWLESCGNHRRMSPLLWEKAMPNELHDKGQRPDEREKLADAFAQADAIKLTMPPEESSGKPWHYVLNADQVTLILKALRSPISAGATCPTGTCAVANAGGPLCDAGCVSASSTGTEWNAEQATLLHAALTVMEQWDDGLDEQDGREYENACKDWKDCLAALRDWKRLHDQQPATSTESSMTAPQSEHLADQRVMPGAAEAVSPIDAGEATLVCRRPDKENTVCLYPKCKCYPVNADAERIGEQLAHATERVRLASAKTQHEDSVLHLALGDLYGCVGRAVAVLKSVPNAALSGDVTEKLQRLAIIALSWIGTHGKRDENGLCGRSRDQYDEAIRLEKEILACLSSSRKAT